MDAENGYHKLVESNRSLLLYIFYAFRTKERNDYMNVEIADKLLQLRKTNGYSQENLAERLGISRQAVSKWERAEASPDTDNLILLAKIYNVSLDELLMIVPVRVNAQGEVVDASTSTETIESTIERLEKIGVKAKEGIKEIGRNKWMTFPYYMIAVILFAIFGFAFNRGWQYSWLFFLTIPLYYTLVLAVSKKNAHLFLYPVLVVLVYLVLCLPIGHMVNMSFWHPYWIMFLTIPIYYWAVAVVRKSKKQNKEENPQ